jgi:hypothetical protein
VEYLRTISALYGNTENNFEETPHSGCLYYFSSSVFLSLFASLYEGVSKSFRTGRLERELQIVQLFATSCSSIAVL